MIEKGGIEISCMLLELSSAKTFCALPFFLAFLRDTMNTIQRLAKNTTALLAQVAGLIIGLVISIFIARNLAAVVFGKYSFAFTAIFAVSSS